MLDVVIKKGTYTFDGFELFVENDIKFCNEKIILIDGETGAGKTTFIKKVLVPTIKDQIAQNKELHYLYFAQELQHQYYFIKSYFSIKDKMSLSGYEIALDYLFESMTPVGSNHIIVIFDETDKYANVKKICEKFLQHKSTIFIISHKKKSDFDFDLTLKITHDDQKRKLYISK